MARRYEIEELLWLRNSPLVTKPDKLPPIEEWMGPIPDPTPRKPTNSRDQPQNDNQNRRPNLFDTRHISRNSNSEDIVLGPPKTAFSSATRLFGKGSIDATDRNSRSNDHDESKADRFNFRDKFAKDRDGPDRDLDRRDNKFGNLQGRRNERDDWNAGRSRRTFNQDEQDPRPRRNGDSTRWDGKDRSDEPGFNRKDKDGRFVKREGQPRGRHEQSWFRDEVAPDTGDLEDEKPYMRNKEWRRGDRQVPDRDWNNRGSRFDQDPEWMNSTDRDEPRQVHTQEDFQRWKEKMKAGSAAPQRQVEEKSEPAPEQPIPEQHKAEHSHLDGELFASNQAHIRMDSGFDKLFGLLNESKPAPQEVSPVAAADTSKKDSASAKVSKSSRFAGLFSPPPESPVKQPEPVPEKARPDRPVSTDADQEGFQRILQMLGGSKSRNATPQLDSTQTSRPPSYSHPDHNRPTPPPPPGLSSPARDPLNRQHEFMTPPQEGIPPHRVLPPPGMESMLPRDPQAQLRDRDNLLRLMQQVKVSPNTPGQAGNASLPSQGGHTPGILSVPDLLSRPQGMQKAPRNQAFLDDPAIANMQRPDMDIHEPSRRPANGPPMGFYEDMPFPGAPQSGRGSAAVPPAGGRPHQGHPSMGGIPRPPGLEQMPPPPPGWAGQLPPQHGGAMGTPSGLPTPSRGINPNFLNGPGPMHGGTIPLGPSQPPPSNERPPFMRGMSSGNAGGNGAGNNFGPPPGMMPPPGYMNANGPPPPAGFPPMPPHNHPEAAAAMMNMGAGSSGPPPSSRHLLDFFAQVNAGGGIGGSGAGDGRGAMLGGPPFR